MFHYKTDEMVLGLSTAPIDSRTGNRVLYSASFIADRDSMVGKVNKDWVRRELDWFRSGSDRLSDMEAPVPQAFQDCAGDDGRVNSAYGHILFSREPVSPSLDSLFDRVVDTFIKEGKGTRHAVAIISDRNIHRLASFNNRRDFICTNALNFMISDDDRLHITAQMRSMDAVWGYRADYSMWDDLMEYLLGSLSLVYPELTRGNIVFQVANLHVYPRHFEALATEAEQIHEKINSNLHKTFGTYAS